MNNENNFNVYECSSLSTYLNKPVKTQKHGKGK